MGGKGKVLSLSGTIRDSNDQPPPPEACIPLELELRYAKTNKLVKSTLALTTKRCELSPDIPGKVFAEFRIEEVSKKHKNQQFVVCVKSMAGCKFVVVGEPSTPICVLSKLSRQALARGEREESSQGNKESQSKPLSRKRLRSPARSDKTKNSKEATKARRRKIARQFTNRRDADDFEVRA